MNQFADAELDDIQDTCDVLYRRIRRLRKLADGYRKLVKASALGNSDLVYDIRASGARSERARIVSLCKELAAEMTDKQIEELDSDTKRAAYRGIKDAYLYVASLVERGDQWVF